MEVFRGAVTVTSSSPLTSAQGHLFYYTPIHPVAVTQSVILSSILESSGDAQLPDTVSIPEFELWQKAVVDREAGNHATHKPVMDLATVCTVLRAADGVGDVKFDQWVSLAWKLLFPKLVHAGWGRERAIESFLQVPEHIQHLIFMVCAREQPETLGMLLQALPQSVHAAMITAFAGPQKTLFVPGRGCKVGEMEQFYKSLANVPAEPPSIQSLVDSPECCFRCDAEGDRFSVAAATALRHHSGLTSLSLSQLCSSQWRMQQLLPAIAALTALKTLDLGAGFLLIPAALSILPDGFPSMHMLQHLKLGLRSTNPDPRDKPGTLRFKAARKGTPPPPSPVCAASPCNEHVVRLLPHLTRLTFLSIYSYVPLHIHDDTANFSTPINMPYLQELRLPGQHNCLPAAILSELEAPVSTASINLFWVAQLQPQHPQQLCKGLQKLVHLTSLSLNILKSDIHVQNAHFSAVFTPLQKLQLLEIDGPFPIVCAAVSSAPPGVTKLSFHVRNNHASPMEQAAAIQMWEQTCESISRMALCSLELRMEMHFRSHNLPGLSRLSRLNRLTVMSLYHWHTCLGHPADRDALSHMTNLQSLQLVGISTDDAVLPSVRTAMVGLPQLHDLRVDTCYVDDRAVFPGAAVAHSVPDGAWQSLVKLEFPVPSVEAARELVLAGIRLPSLQELGVQAAGWIELPNNERADLERLAAGRGLSLILRRFAYSQDEAV